MSVDGNMSVYGNMSGARQRPLWRLIDREADWCVGGCVGGCVCVWQTDDQESYVLRLRLVRLSLPTHTYTPSLALPTYTSTPCLSIYTHTYMQLSHALCVSAPYVSPPTLGRRDKVSYRTLTKGAVEERRDSHTQRETSHTRRRRRDKVSYRTLYRLASYTTPWLLHYTLATDIHAHASPVHTYTYTYTYT